MQREYNKTWDALGLVLLPVFHSLAMVLSRFRLQTTALQLCIAVLIIVACVVPLRAQHVPDIRIVGSSSVYPYFLDTLERYAVDHDVDFHIVSTGSNGGVQVFCKERTLFSPQFLISSHKLSAQDVALCAQNTLSLVEFSFGFDGVVLVNSIENIDTGFSVEHLFLALSEQIAKSDGTFIKNPYTSWADIDPALTRKEIFVLLPPETSATRDYIITEIMIPGCRSYFRRLGMEVVSYDRVCGQFRTDGRVVTTSEKDSALVDKLAHNTDAFGIVGSYYLFHNPSRVKSVSINGVQPTYGTLSDQTYSLIRPLYLYVRLDALEHDQSASNFLRFFSASENIGRDGALAKLGLISYPDDQLQINSSLLFSGKVFKGE